MRRIWVPLIVVLICLPVGILATGIPLPYVDRPMRALTPQYVPTGDQEIAWLYTATSSQTWERFVTGVQQATLEIDGMIIDDSAAFPNRTTATPEVVLSLAGSSGKLHIRWYKLTNDTKAEQWVRALAQRSPPPLGIIGGGSTDRAVDLAQAMQQTEDWRGPQSALLLTRATSDSVTVGKQSTLLMDLYPCRSFRFCFTNRQMAEGVLDFVQSQPELRPDVSKPTLINVTWNDDPYSIDLAEQFEIALQDENPRIIHEQLPHSVGGRIRANNYERQTAESIVEAVQASKDERILLALPTVSRPAGRLLRRICTLDPTACKQIVAVTGDGISVNNIFRDRAFSWPAEEMPVPLVLFTHNNPAGWETDSDLLDCPSSTEDLLFNTEMIEVIAASAWPADNGLSLVADADAFIENLHEHPLFDAVGNRDESSGEHVVVLHPKRSTLTATMEVWRKDRENGWEQIKDVTIPAE